MKQGEREQFKYNPRICLMINTKNANHCSQHNEQLQKECVLLKIKKDAIIGSINICSKKFGSIE